MPTYYKNKTTHKVITIVKENERYVQVRYLISKLTYWYTKEDFKKLFKKIR